MSRGWLVQASNFHGALHTLNGMLLKSETLRGVADVVWSTSPCWVIRPLLWLTLRRFLIRFSIRDIQTRAMWPDPWERNKYCIKIYPIIWLMLQSQRSFGGKYFVHIHKWALLIARFYAQFKFKSFLLDTANTSVTRLLIFLLYN